MQLVLQGFIATVGTVGRLKARAEPYLPRIYRIYSNTWVVVKIMGAFGALL